MRPVFRRSLLTLGFTTVLVLLGMWQGSNHQSVKAEDGSVPAATGSVGIWYGGSNLGTLTVTPASIIQPAPKITQAGNYMFVGNLSVQETNGGYPEVSCFVQVGNTALLASVTGVDASQQGNVTATGAIKLTSTQVPATAALMCGNINNNGTATVTSGSLAIFSVGTLQIGK